LKKKGHDQHKTRKEKEIKGGEKDEGGRRANGHQDQRLVKKKMRVRKPNPK